MEKAKPVAHAAFALAAVSSPGSLLSFVRYFALGMKILSSRRYKNIGEQLKVLRNKGSRFFLMLPVRS
jgi:hypothetical protein